MSLVGFTAQADQNEEMGSWKTVWLALAFTLPCVTRARGAPEKYAYPMQRIERNGLTAMQITGVKGSLKLRGRRSAKYFTLKVQHSKGHKFEDWHLSVERRGHTLFLEVFNAAYGAQWKRQIQAESWPEFDIEIEGPSLATTVSWNEGHLDFSNWDENLDLSFLKGEARSVGGHGSITLQPIEAKVDIREHTGSLFIKGESGQVVLDHNRGPLHLNWLSGEIELRNCQGKIILESRESTISVHGGTGQLELQLDKGKARVSSFVGTVQGRGRQAKWEISAMAPTDVNITSSSGPVGVAWTAGGAKVFLTSTLGSISKVPGSTFLRSSQHDSRKVMEGTRSARSMGQVFIRTDSGAIRWLE